ncbi:hypothetical protein SFRURICE_007093 [Spodoptera frugiperda]|nr:hypothetical protein SFRURICE_007093 [Spodoptera frugiperda]
MASAILWPATYIPCVDYQMHHTRSKMAKVATVFAFMVLLAVIVEGRDWRFDTKRVKRGYNPGTYGNNNNNNGGTYGRNDDQNDNFSRERLGCSEELGGGSYGSGSHELSYNKDGRPKDNRRHRSFTKASASASATATSFNENHKANL